MIYLFFLKSEDGHLSVLLNRRFAYRLIQCRANVLLHSVALLYLESGMCYTVAEKKMFVISGQKSNAVMVMMGMQCDYLMHGGNLGNGGQQ